MRRVEDLLERSRSVGDTAGGTTAFGDQHIDKRFQLERSCRLIRSDCKRAPILANSDGSQPSVL